MKNISEPQAANADDDVVAWQLSRLEEALGEDWMHQLHVAPETVRTWKKRKNIPLSQLKKASVVSGRNMNWFIANHSEPREGVFFEQKKKQVSPVYSPDIGSGTLLVEMLTHVMSLVDEELDMAGLELPPGKKAQLIAVLYQRFVERAQSGVSASTDGDTVRQYLKLVA